MSGLQHTAGSWCGYWGYPSLYVWFLTRKPCGKSVAFLTWPNTKQYKVIPIAQTSKAFEEREKERLKTTYFVFSHSFSFWKLSVLILFGAMPKGTNQKATSDNLIPANSYQMVGEQWLSLSQHTFPENIFLVSERVSGAMNAGVPTVLDKRASVPLNSLLTPKSAILMCPSSPTKRLEGLISRWIIFW